MISIFRFYFLSSPSKWTMPLSVYQFFGQFSKSNWNYVFADLTLTILPVFIVFFIRAKTYYQWTDRRVGKGLMFSAAGEKFGEGKAYKGKSSGFK